MKRNIDLSVYVILDIDYIISLDKNWRQCLLSTIAGGATAIQLRSKSLNDRMFHEIALGALKICRRKHIPFIINDRVAAAMAAGADGVHVGKSDMPFGAVKKLVKDDMIIGVSASSLKEAVVCDRLKPAYIGVGPVFATGQKSTKPVGASSLKKIAGKINTPMVAIGGINGYNIARLKKIGIKNYSFISAVFSSDDIRGQTRRLRSIITSKEI
jgi:thiamine-phosphate pyrophosphorylase